jgi:hypothetical protein
MEGHGGNSPSGLLWFGHTACNVADMAQYQPDPVANKIIGAAIEVHRQLGPGLLESAYQTCLLWELVKTGIPVEREVPVPLIYKGRRMVRLSGARKALL